MVPAAGDLIAERYRLDQPIESDPMGSIWRATHIGLHKVVSVKLMSAVAAADPRLVQRFNHEAVLAAKIKSDHVVRIHDHGHHHGVPFIVVEHVAGETLRRLLSVVGRFDLKDTAEIVRQVCRALGAAHDQGLVHRDIRPDNILVGQTAVEGEYRIRVLDFGAAKASDTIGPSGIDPTHAGDVVGMPYYLSPEQARGAGEIGPAADLWSLAVVVYECLTGERPFTAASVAPLILAITQGEVPVPSRVVGGLPDAVDAWFGNALARDPSQRFGSARAMSRAFHLASGVLEEPSGAGQAALSFDSMSVTMKTIRIEKDELTDNDPTRVKGLRPVDDALERSDDQPTTPALDDLRDVDPDMAQLPPNMVAQREQQLAAAPVANGQLQQPAANVYPQQPAANGYPPWPGGAPSSDGYPPTPAFPPPMQVPAEPDPMTIRPTADAYAPVTTSGGSPSWQEDSLSHPPMRKSRAGVWIGALAMLLVGGGVAAYVMRDSILPSDSVADNDDDNVSKRRKKKREQTDDDDEPSAEPEPAAPPSAAPSAVPEPTPSETAAPSAPEPPPPTPPTPTPQPEAARPTPKPPPAQPARPAPPRPQPPSSTHRKTLE